MSHSTYSFNRKIGLALCLNELREQALWLKETGRDLELQDITLSEVLEGDWKAVAHRTSKLLDGFEGRLGIHGPFWHLNIAPRDPAVRRLVQSRLNLGLDFAHMVGGTHMVIHSPFDFFGHPMTVPGHRLPLEIERVHETLLPIVKRATEQGVTLVIENIYDLNPQPLLKLVKSFNTPNVRLSVDTGHAHLMTQRGGPPPATWIAEAGDLLGHIHLCDNDTTNDQHLAPEKGTIHWASVLSMLQNSPIDTRMLVEVKPPEIEDGKQWIEGLSQKQ